MKVYDIINFCGGIILIENLRICFSEKNSSFLEYTESIATIVDTIKFVLSR